MCIIRGLPIEEGMRQDIKNPSCKCLELNKLTRFQSPKSMPLRQEPSSNHKLIVKDGKASVIENGFWQGTLIYLEIGTSKEIDPNQIVDHRTDAAEQYNETFVETGELDSLW